VQYLWFPQGKTTKEVRLFELIEDLPDPRMQGKVQHNFGAIVFVTMCVILSGCESWVDIADYCEAKVAFSVCLSNGVPSEWTFRRVFTMIDPAALEALLRAHAAETVLPNKQSDQIAIDGKALRGSKRQGCVPVCIL